MNSIKSVLRSIAFLLGAGGFFLLIGFEIHYGVAGGTFGGAAVVDMPATFWLFISLQTLWGLSLVADAIKEAWTQWYGPIEGSPRQGRLPPEGLLAMFWISATIALAMIGLVAVWSAGEMLFHMYQVLADVEMPKKAIMGGLFLVVIMVMGTVFYTFLFRTLVDTVWPKARMSAQLLRRKPGL